MRLEYLFKFSSFYLAVCFLFWFFNGESLESLIYLVVSLVLISGSWFAYEKGDNIRFILFTIVSILVTSWSF